MRRASNARAVGAQCCSGGRGVGGGSGLSGGCLLLGHCCRWILKRNTTVTELVPDIGHVTYKQAILQGSIKGSLSTLPSTGSPVS